MIFRALIIGITATVVGGVVIGALEKLGPFGVILMPAVGLGIGGLVRATVGASSAWSVSLAATLAYAAAMSTHIPSAYEMLRDLGGTVVRSAFLSVIVSVKYPLVVSSEFGFYCLMLILSVAGAGWGAA